MVKYLFQVSMRIKNVPKVKNTKNTRFGNRKNINE